MVREEVAAALASPSRGRRHTIKDSINYRRHRNACPHYRENWDLENALYQCICLKDTPPLTQEEQEKCFSSRRRCWRDKARTARNRLSVVTGRLEVGT